MIAAGDHFYVIPTDRIEARTGLVLRPSGYEPYGTIGQVPEVNTEDYREAWFLLSKEV